jgi:acetoin utilization deacetylase AcuC-like enzyme
LGITSDNIYYVNYNKVGFQGELLKITRRLSMNTLTKGSPVYTGIFYHPSFSRRSYLTRGSRLQDFPNALNPLLEDARYRLFESPPVDEEWILKVHSAQLIEGVRQDPLCTTAWHSVGGVVLAAEKIWQGEITNAFAFIGAGGHHSGRNYFGGYCCFNDVVIAMRVLRERLGVTKFAILDTDAHHGDGTRDLVKDDPNVLHVCLCSSHYESPDGTKVDVPVPGRPLFYATSSSGNDVNSLYAADSARAFEPRVRDFKPELIFWYFGFDTHTGDYGDIGLTLDAYLLIARMVKQLAEDICNGRLEVVLAGGSRSDIARRVIPPIIEILGES